MSIFSWLVSMPSSETGALALSHGLIQKTCIRITDISNCKEERRITAFYFFFQSIQLIGFLKCEITLAEAELHHEPSWDGQCRINKSWPMKEWEILAKKVLCFVLTSLYYALGTLKKIALSVLSESRSFSFNTVINMHWWLFACFWNFIIYLLNANRHKELSERVYLKYTWYDACWGVLGTIKCCINAKCNY